MCSEVPSSEAGAAIVCCISVGMVRVNCESLKFASFKLFMIDRKCILRSKVLER